MRDLYSGFVLVVTYTHVMKAINEKCKTDFAIANPAPSESNFEKQTIYVPTSPCLKSCHMHTLYVITATSVTQICILKRYTV